MYFAVAGGALYWACRRPRFLRARAIGVVIALALLGFVPGNYILRAVEQRHPRVEFEKYREAAWAHFRKRCKENAGEKIFNVVPNVKGIFLDKPRRRPRQSDLRNRNWKGDPYGLDYYGDAEIVTYLYRLNEKGVPTTGPGVRGSYDFVETRDPNSHLFVRFVRSGKDRISSELVKTRSSRYEITWEDISSAEDRKYWIAGGKLRVIDGATNAVLGQRIGYLIDPGFGSTSGARVPWLHARLHASESTCPPVQPNAATNRLFVEKVLIPSGDTNRGK